MFFETFLLKCLDGIDILRTFALAFAQKRLCTRFRPKTDKSTEERVL